MIEKWISIRGYEGLYEISDMGRVRALRFINRMINKPLPVPRLRKTPRLSTGYNAIILHRDGIKTQHSVHRLLLENFVGPAPTPGHECAHLDGNPTNSILSNLAWVTGAENQAHRIQHGTDLRGERNPRTGITEDQARQILALRKEGITPAEITRKLGIRHSIVAQVGVSSWLWLLEDPARSRAQVDAMFDKLMEVEGGRPQ